MVVKEKENHKSSSLVSENIIMGPNLRMRRGLKEMWEGHNFTCTINPVFCSMYKLSIHSVCSPPKIKRHTSCLKW